MSENVHKVAADALRDMDLKMEKWRREGEERVEKINRQVEELDRKSMENFAAWRDYLHKYYVLILAFVGGSGIFTASQGLNSAGTVWGTYLALGGIFVGFVAINVYFYLERRWFQISSYVTTAGGFAGNDKHPEVEDDPIRASRLNLSEKIKALKVQLKDAKKSGDRKKAQHLRLQIKGHKSEKGLMKYLGQQFGAIESFWVASVVVSLSLTSVGVAMIFHSLLSN